jgi:hypothetical protein
MTVRDKYSDEETTVTEWECQCGLTEKFGLPCTHLIACLRAAPHISYKQFFSKRWGKILSRDQ